MRISPSRVNFWTTNQKTALLLLLQKKQKEHVQHCTPKSSNAHTTLPHKTCSTPWGGKGMGGWKNGRGGKEEGGGGGAEGICMDNGKGEMQGRERSG